MPRRVPNVPAAGWIVALLSLALLIGFARSGGAQDHELYHGDATAVLDCMESGTPPGKTAPSPATPGAWTGQVADLDFGITATDSNPANGLPVDATLAELSTTDLTKPLRLYTRGVTPGEILPMWCYEGLHVIYVMDGALLLTVAGPDETQGLVTVSLAGEGRFVVDAEENECSLDCTLPAGATVTLVAGDAVFAEEGVFSLANVGRYTAHLLVAAVAPEELPCTGRPC